MIFLIEYDRRRGAIVKLKRFRDSERAAATRARLELELKRHKSRIASEIVLLNAASEQALRRTHRRYFETLSELVEGFQRALG